MPVPYKGYTVPELDDPAHAPDAFKQYTDSLVAAGGGGVPVGCVMPYVGDTAPDSTWKICDGSSLDVTIYNELYAVIGSKFGTASAGFFKIPDLRGAVPRGAGTSGLNGAWDGGAVGAAPSASPTVSLTSAHLPSHTHTVPAHAHTAGLAGATAAGNGTHAHGFALMTSSGGGHDHDTKMIAPGDFNRNGSNPGARMDSNTSGNRTAVGGAHTHSVTGSISNDGFHSHTVSGTVSVSSGGGGATGEAGSSTPTAINVVGPAVAVNYLIKVKP